MLLFRWLIKPFPSLFWASSSSYHPLVCLFSEYLRACSQTELPAAETHRSFEVAVRVSADACLSVGVWRLLKKQTGGLPSPWCCSSSQGVWWCPDLSALLWGTMTHKIPLQYILTQRWKRNACLGFPDGLSYHGLKARWLASPWTVVQSYLNRMDLMGF